MFSQKKTNTYPFHERIEPKHAANHEARVAKHLTDLAALSSVSHLSLSGA
jgi:hypothetical protein